MITQQFQTNTPFFSLCLLILISAAQVQSWSFEL